ncbi:unnamed protein product [Didymodactylos carnosus]|uniref:Uncharacterized protein n=1 Tax=Didymodactylos carnosus TaxID=1234261 RepID=A0A815E2T4_9BILA|nr:unnamed protein product [Didymodactylos carnosus]CAF4134770.1 unnamed protein product [Didymodactylos carnosus]
MFVTLTKNASQSAYKLLLNFEKCVQEIAFDSKLYIGFSGILKSDLSFFDLFMYILACWMSHPFVFKLSLPPIFVQNLVIKPNEKLYCHLPVHTSFAVQPY